MTKLLASLAAFTALTAAASAADLPRRAAPPPVFTPVPVFTWTGAYFGINAGYAFDASSNNTNSFGVPAPALRSKMCMWPGLAVVTYMRSAFLLK